MKKQMKENMAENEREDAALVEWRGGEMSAIGGVVKSPQTLKHARAAGDQCPCRKRQRSW